MGGYIMQITLHRSMELSLDYNNIWEIENVDMEGDLLINFLYDTLMKTKEGSLDPILANNTPDIFLKNLQNGKLGDFSKHYIIIAKDNEKTIGILIGLPDKNENNSFHIYSLDVLPEYRGKGVGTNLIGCCLDNLSNSPYKNTIIDVAPTNIPAIKLYNKLGFNE